MNSPFLLRASGARRNFSARVAAARAQRAPLLPLVVAVARRLVYTRLVLTTLDVEALASRPIESRDEVRLLADREIDLFLAFRPGSDRRVIESRLAAGHECVCVWDEGAIVSAIWVRYDAIWLPELRDMVSLPADCAYAYDSYTAQSHRSRGLVTRRAPHTARHVRTRGCNRILGYVRSENTAGLAATRAAGSSSFASLAWLHLGPVGVETVRSATRRRTALRLRGRADELQTGVSQRDLCTPPEAGMIEQWTQPG